MNGTTTRRRAPRPSWTLLLLPLAAAALFASGVVSAEPSGAITVGPAANGSTRLVRRGDQLVVRLPSNPSTGYRWVVRDGARPVLVLVRRSYVAPTGAPMLGAPGTAVLRFRVVARGRAQLRLAYVRSWEAHGSPARTFALRLVAS